MGNEKDWSLQEIFAGMNMLNYLDKTKGMPGNEFVHKLIALLLVAEGSNLNNLLFTHREYERPLHIVKESGQNVEVIESIMNSQANTLPYAERTMIKAFSNVLKKSQ